LIYKPYGLQVLVTTNKIVGDSLPVGHVHIVTGIGKKTEKGEYTGPRIHIA